MRPTYEALPRQVGATQSPTYGDSNQMESTQTCCVL